jgi:O-antigen ligase
MTPTTLDAAKSYSLRAAGIDRALRDVLFLATFLLIWLTATPYPDLADPKLLEPVGDGNRAGQILTLLMTIALAAFVFAKDARIVLKALTPILVLTFLWFAVSAAFSPHAALAARRLVLAAAIIVQAAVFVVVPQDRDQFSRLLLVGALTVLALCYAGVILMPEISIHQSTDLAEPELDGNWRGFFTHKNGAGAGMVVLTFIGIFITRTLSPILGVLVIALATLFLVFTESKSPMGLLPLVLVASVVLVRLRNPAVKYIFAAALPVTISILTIGSVMFEPINALVGRLLSDPSFTGRDDIWRFAIDHIAQRPIFGFGFQAFWGTAELVSQWTYMESWGYRASDAHNGFLNVAVMTGLVGLGLGMVWVFVQPLADLIRTPRDRADPALTMLFVQIWLFGLCLSAFESELFNGGSVVWFMMAIAIIGLRYQAIAQVAR